MPDSKQLALPDLLRRIVRALHQRHQEFVRQYSGADGFTTAQASVLRALALNQRLSLAELSRYIGLSTSHTSGIVDKLVRDGLVLRDRDLNDRRVVWISLSEVGEKFADDFTRKHSAYFNKLFDRLTADETKVMIEQLTKLIEILDVEDPHACTAPEPGEKGVGG